MESLVNSRRGESSFTALARLEELEDAREREEVEKNGLNRCKNDGENENENRDVSHGDGGAGMRTQDAEGEDDEENWTKASPGRRTQKSRKMRENTKLNMIDMNEQSTDRVPVTAAAETKTRDTTKEMTEITSYVGSSTASFEERRKRKEQGVKAKEYTEIGQKGSNEGNEGMERTVGKENQEIAEKILTNQEMRSVTTEGLKDNALLLKAVEVGQERARQDTEKEEQARKERMKQVNRITKEKADRMIEKAAQQAKMLADAQQLEGNQSKGTQSKGVRQPKPRSQGLDLDKEWESILHDSEKEAGLEERAKTMTLADRKAAFDARRIQAKGVLMASGRKDATDGTVAGSSVSGQVPVVPELRTCIEGPYSPPRMRESQKFMYENMEEDNDESLVMSSEDQEPSSEETREESPKTCVKHQPMRKPSQFFFHDQGDKNAQIQPKQNQKSIIATVQRVAAPNDVQNIRIAHTLEHEESQTVIEPKCGQAFNNFGFRQNTIVRMEVVRKKTEPSVSYSMVISGTVAQLWLADGGAFIRSTKNPVLTIRQQSEMPADETAGHEFFDIIEKPMGNQIKTTIMFQLESKFKLNELKQDGRLFHHIQSNGIFLFPHKHKTINITAIGWISEREVALTDTDQVALDMTDALARFIMKKARTKGSNLSLATARSQVPTLECAKTRIAYKPPDQKHVYIDALEVKCEYTMTEQLRKILFEATSAGEMPKRKLGFFVPYRAKADPILYQATVKRHLQFLDEASACIVRGLHETVLKSIIECPIKRTNVQIEECLLAATYDARNDRGQMIRRYTIRAIERTRKSESEGKYRITFTKESATAAHTLIDKVLCEMGTASEEHKVLADTGDPYKGGVRRGKGRYDATVESSLLLMDNLISERQQILDKNFRVRDNSMVPQDFGPHEYDPDAAQAVLPNPWFDSEKRATLLNQSDDSSYAHPQTAAHYVIERNNISTTSTLDTSIVGSIQSELSQCKLDVAYLRTAMEKLMEENSSLKETQTSKEASHKAEQQSVDSRSQRREELLMAEIKKLEKVNLTQQQEYSASLNAIVTKLNVLELDKEVREKEQSATSSKLDQLLLLFSAQQKEAETKQRTRKVKLARVSVQPSSGTATSPKIRSPTKAPTKTPSPLGVRSKRNKSVHQPTELKMAPLDSYAHLTDSDMGQSPVQATLEESPTQHDGDTPMAEFSPPTTKSSQRSMATTQKNLSDIMTAVSSAAKSLIGREPPKKMSSLSRAAEAGQSKWQETSQNNSEQNRDPLPNSNCSATISNIADESTDDFFDTDDECNNRQESYDQDTRIASSFGSVSFDGEDDELVGTTLGVSHPGFKDLSTIAPTQSDSEDRTGWSDKDEESQDMDDSHGDSEEEKERNIIQGCQHDMQNFLERSYEEDPDCSYGDIDDEPANNEMDNSADSQNPTNKSIMAGCYKDMYPHIDNDEDDDDEDDDVSYDSEESTQRAIMSACNADMAITPTKEAPLVAKRTGGPKTRN